MKNKKSFFTMMLQFLVLILIVGFFASDIVKVTYAIIQESRKPIHVTITIDKDGKVIQEGNIFGEDLWYPDNQGRTGVIRIQNQFKGMKITSLTLDRVELTKTKDGYTRDYVYDSFLKHMKLTMFSETKSFGALLDKSESNGFVLKEVNQFVAKGGTKDLEYTLYMDEEAGNELQDLIADVSFVIKSPTIHEDDDDGDDSDNDNEMPVLKTPASCISDIQGHWAHDCIITLLEKGIIRGYEDGSIKPDRNITRAEAAVLVGTALGLEPKTTLLPKYIDSIPDWAKGYINATTEKNIFIGYPFKLFKPNKFITREEMIAVLTRAFELQVKTQGLELPFKDSQDISAWAEESVRAGFDNKVIGGYPDGTYRPQNNITRAEAFTIICKLLGYHNEHTIKQSSCF